MNRKRLIAWVSALMLAFGWSSASSADVAPEVVALLGNAGVMYKMCDAEADATDCLAASGDEIVLDTAGFSSVVIDFSPSTATGGFTCDVHGSAVGHDDLPHANALQDLTATQFSTTTLIQTLPLTPRYIWINCDGTPTGGTLTVHALGRLER